MLAPKYFANPWMVLTSILGLNVVCEFLAHVQILHHLPNFVIRATVASMPEGSVIHADRCRRLVSSPFGGSSFPRKKSSGQKER